MFLDRKLWANPAYRAGIADMAPQAPGMAAWGLMTGVAIATSGLTAWEAWTLGLLVFAGSSQLASLPLLVAGAPPWVVLATGFCVNLRFVVFSLHLRPHLMHLPLWRRLIHGYLTADVSYILFTRRYSAPATSAQDRLAQEAYLAGNCGLNWCCWTAASALGLALAHSVPSQWGLGFAGILCLVGILCSLATTRLRLVAIVVAGTVGVTAYALPLKLNIVLAIAITVLLCVAFEQVSQPDPNRKGAAG